MQESIKRLEEKVAYLERHVTEQDKAMLEFAEELTRLRRELLRLSERSAPGAGGGREVEERTPEEERPPHY